MTQTISKTQGAGFWHGDANALVAKIDANAVERSMRQVTSVVYDAQAQTLCLATGGRISNDTASDGEPLALMATLGPLYPEWLGGRDFAQTHRLRFAYLGGAMANGITTPQMVVALAEMGGMGMFGSAGLPLEKIEAAIDYISQALDERGLSWGSNLIHSPNEPALEDHIVALYLRRGVRRVDASAYMGLTPAVVRYACTGLSRNAQGEVVRYNHLFAKISREEVAKHFLSPAPEAILNGLVAQGQLTAQEAQLARELPLAQSLIVEADSGGHTDNRPLTALFPVIAALREQRCQQHQFKQPIYLGAAGGLGTPEAVAAAFALGADFVVIGSVHQSALESGVSPESRALLAQAGPADVAMVAAADMFEMGVKVQVLKRGTMMAVRGNQLFELYKRHASLDAIPAETRAGLEKNVFRMPLSEVWQQTQAFFERTDPTQIERAQRDAKHKMALVFRWYLGSSSRWPLNGPSDRQIDFQLWCGPAMGAFNRWVKGSFLEPVEQRSVQQIALNLMEGAAFVTRAHQYRTFGLSVSASAFNYRPTPLKISNS
jgi:trans-AT polyketide synthase, acyltransferase and oxidoreductase domains